MPNLEDCTSSKRKWVVGDSMTEKDMTPGELKRANYIVSTQYQVDSDSLDQPQFGSIYVKGRPEIPNAMTDATE